MAQETCIHIHNQREKTKETTTLEHKKRKQNTRPHMRRTRMRAENTSPAPTCRIVGDPASSQHVPTWEKTDIDVGANDIYLVVETRSGRTYVNARYNHQERNSSTRFVEDVLRHYG